MPSSSNASNVSSAVIALVRDELENRRHFRLNFCAHCGAKAILPNDRMFVVRPLVAYAVVWGRAPLRMPSKLFRCCSDCRERGKSYVVPQQFLSGHWTPPI